VLTSSQKKQISWGNPAESHCRQLFRIQIIEKNQIWDTAGQERFNSLGTAFYRGSDACVLVFDVNNHFSFENVDLWKQKFSNQLGLDESKKFPFVLVANKIDTPENRKVFSTPL
jgi:small GTP-binding protein